MKNVPKKFIFHKAIPLVFVCFGLIGCQPGSAQNGAQLNEPTLVPTAAVPSATSTNQPTSQPTHTPTNQPTPRPTHTPTTVPTATEQPTEIPPTFTAVPSPTATHTPAPTVAAGEPCPDPAPLKPDYQRYFLSPRPWPQPDFANQQPHFWLAKPLPGGGRLLINKTYPYGFDGNGRYLLHNGVDSAEALGTPILAVADGTVIVAQSDQNALFGWRCNWYGELVVILLDQTWQNQPMFALYGHVLNINVEVGDRVAMGDQVAEVGFGGAALVPHLHFELRIGENNFDSTRNPMLWIPPGPTRGVIVGRLLDPEGRPWQGATVTLVGPDGESEFINTYTYLDDPRSLINPDEWYAENFVFADVRPGEYTVDIRLQDVTYRDQVNVIGGELTFLEIITEPFKSGD